MTKAFLRSRIGPHSKLGILRGSAIWKEILSKTAYEQSKIEISTSYSTSITFSVLPPAWKLLLLDKDERTGHEFPLVVARMGTKWGKKGVFLFRVSGRILWHCYVSIRKPSERQIWHLP